MTGNSPLRSNSTCLFPSALSPSPRWDEMELILTPGRRHVLGKRQADASYKLLRSRMEASWCREATYGFFLPWPYSFHTTCQSVALGSPGRVRMSSSARRENLNFHSNRSDRKNTWEEG